jgi:hypothetical protein
MKVELEFIDDDSVTDVIKDINTGEVIAIYTDDEIKISTSYNKTVTVRRYRIFTESKIQVQYKMINGQAVPGSIKDRTMKNPIGILPVPFANNTDGREIRGYSDLERVVSSLKLYHDTTLAEHDMLAKFKAKLVQMTDNVDAWISQNGWDDFDDIDIASTDIIVNRSDKESTTFVFAEHAADAYRQAKKQLFKLIVESCGVPEIVFGIKTQGNANTAEEQMAALVMYVKDKQRDKVNPYELLFSGILNLLSIVNNEFYDPEDLTTVWDELDSVSDKTKSEIFKNFADGLSKVVNVTSLTKQQLYKLWKINFPKATEEDFEDFVIGLADMGRHKQWSNASLMEGSEYGGSDESGNLTDKT